MINGLSDVTSSDSLMILCFIFLIFPIFVGDVYQREAGQTNEVYGNIRNHIWIVHGLHMD